MGRNRIPGPYPFQALLLPLFRKKLDENIYIVHVPFIVEKLYTLNFWTYKSPYIAF